MSARTFKEGIAFCGSTSESAETAKYSVEERLQILNMLELRVDDREEHGHHVIHGSGSKVESLCRIVVVGAQRRRRLIFVRIACIDGRLFK